MSVVNETKSAEADERFRREIQMVYGQRGAEKGRAVHVEHLEMRSGELSLFRRARPVLERYKHQTFDYIFVARPDMVLVNAATAASMTMPLSSSVTEQSFNLNSLCHSHPGFNIVSGFFERPGPFHNRDWDWAYLLCNGRQADLARPVLYEDGPCHDFGKEGCVPPPLPPDFTSSVPWTCNTPCRWVEGLHGKMRFGTLDDSVFGFWPPDIPRSSLPEQVPRDVAVMAN